MSFVYPAILQQVFNLFFRYLELDPMGPAVENITKAKSEVFTLIITLQAAFVGATFLLSIFLSHRIAGPLYKLGKYFDKGAEGDISEDLHFRKADHFKELASKYNHFLVGLRGRFSRSASLAVEATEAIERLESQPEFSQLSSNSDWKKIREKLAEIKKTNQ